MQESKTENGKPLVFSIVVPMYNEEHNVGPLCAEIKEAFSGFREPWELVIVDDGSSDGTADKVEAECEAAGGIRLVRRSFRRGQSASLCAGFSECRGEFIGTLDGDLQNDPRDLLRMLKHLRELHVDMVTGWRRQRRDSYVRRISSRIANWVRNTVTGDRVIDVGCTTRVFRRSCLASLPLFFDGMHRFFPLLFRTVGFKVEEVPVNHRPRRFGKTKYGVWNRLWRGLRDLFGVRWVCDRYLKEGKDVVLNSAAYREKQKGETGGRA